MKQETGRAVVKTFAVLSWIEGLMLLAVAAGFLVLGPSVGAFIGADQPGLGQVLGGVGIGAAVVLGAMALLYLLNGFGLWRFRNWGRVLTLVLGVLSLFAFPIGTVIGIITIWLFGFNDLVRNLFRRKARA